MALDSMLGVRVAEARQAYASEDGFEWGSLKRICYKEIVADNLAMQQEMVARSFSSSSGATSASESD